MSSCVDPNSSIGITAAHQLPPPPPPPEEPPLKPLPQLLPGVLAISLDTAVPLLQRRCCVDVAEDARPLFDAAEDDRERQVLGEDVRLLRELRAGAPCRLCRSRALLGRAPAAVPCGPLATPAECLRTPASERAWLSDAGYLRNRSTLKSGGVVSWSAIRTGRRNQGCPPLLACSNRCRTALSMVSGAGDGIRTRDLLFTK